MRGQIFPYLLRFGMGACLEGLELKRQQAGTS
jgi:hypothetical protein